MKKMDDGTLLDLVYRWQGFRGRWKIRYDHRSC